MVSVPTLPGRVGSSFFSPLTRVGSASYSVSIGIAFVSTLSLAGTLTIIGVAALVTISETSATVISPVLESTL